MKLTRLQRDVAIVIVDFLSIFFLIIVFPWAIAVRFFTKTDTKNPRLIWGPVPIINNSHWSRAMKEVGFSSETCTANFFASINCRDDWDRMINEDYKLIPLPFRHHIAFLFALIRYDVFFCPISGGFLGQTGLWRFESLLLKIARKKIVIIPYGGDAYIYSNIRSTALTHGLLMSYPLMARKERIISKKVAYWRKNADVIVPGWIGFDGLGRWDIVLGSQLHIDTNQWKASKKESLSDGVNGTVTLTHTPNHRGFKGTEFIIEAVKKIQADGIKVKLNLIEKKQNYEVKKILEEETDILIEQIIVTGHGLSGVEGLASGITVISNLEDENYVLPVRRWSFFSECPIVSATPENIEETLRKLISNPSLRNKLGKAGRKYTEKYHSYPAAQYMFKEIIEFLYGRRETLINLYHPLLGEYNKTLPYVEHPLVKNKIPTDDI